MFNQKQFLPLQPKVVLGVAAHPDDLDVIAGGTLAQFAQHGAQIHYLILTDGGKGSDDSSMTSAELTELRRAEQQVALEMVGGTSITFLDYPDGELENTLELKKQIVKEIRRVKPDVVITMDPTVVYSASSGRINHPDHRAAGHATLDAVFPLARDRLAFPDLLTEGHDPHKVATVLLSNFDSNNFEVDISDTYPIKLEAIKAHASQFSTEDSLNWVEISTERFVRLDII